MNTLCEKKYLEGKEKEYRDINYINSKATVLGEIKGKNNFINEE